MLNGATRKPCWSIAADPNQINRPPVRGVVESFDDPFDSSCIGQGPSSR